MTHAAAYLPDSRDLLSGRRRALLLLIQATFSGIRALQDHSPPQCPKWFPARSRERTVTGFWAISSSLISFRIYRHQLAVVVSPVSRGPPLPPFGHRAGHWRRASSEARAHSWLQPPRKRDARGPTSTYQHFSESSKT